MKYDETFNAASAFAPDHATGSFPSTDRDEPI